MTVASSRDPIIEKRLLQAAVIVGALVPVSAGLAGIVMGSALVETRPPDIDADSHFRYLSGLLLAIGLGFMSLVPKIETRTSAFRLLTFLVVTGGIARLVSWAVLGKPGAPMVAGLIMELLITPALCLWQGALARRFHADNN